MTVKLLEIRDRGTTVPAMAIEVSGGDGWLMRRAGFDSPMIYLIMLATEKCHYDPYRWENPRTMRNAHLYIESHWHDLQNGDVVDVEYILGETATPKRSESETVGMR